MRALALALVLALPVAGAAQYDPNQPQPRRPPGHRAAGPRDQGITLSARLGFGSPAGDTADSPNVDGYLDPPLEDMVRHKVPIWLELGYRFNPAVWGGLYLELAPASVDRAYCPTRRCDAADVRLGVDMQFHFMPYASVDPWIGVGIGMEFLSAELEDSAGGISQFDWAGLELPLLEAGLDLAISPRATIGPYVAWSVGQFTRSGIEYSGYDVSGSIDDRAIHTWFQIGVKGTLKL